MEQKWLLIDDQRNPNDLGCECVIARTFDEGLAALQEGESYTLLLLDHDLGDPDPKKTGWDLLCWLEEHSKHIPERIKIITNNGAVFQKMQKLADKLYKIRNNEWHDLTW